MAVSLNSGNGWYGQVFFSRCSRERNCSLDILRGKAVHEPADIMSGTDSCSPAMVSESALYLVAISATTSEIRNAQQQGSPWYA